MRKALLAITSLTLVIIGTFLVLDSVFFHAIHFDYSIFGLEFLNQYIQHWMWGILLIIIGGLGLRHAR